MGKASVKLDTATLGRIVRRRTDTVSTDAITNAGLDALGADPPFPFYREDIDEAVAVRPGGARPGDALYRPMLDINEDGRINVADQGLASAIGVPNRPVGPPPGARDPRLQPFASDSVWNTAIGSGALYSQPLGLHVNAGFWTDEEPIIMGRPGDPLKDVWVNGNWPISGALAGQKLGYRLPVPSGMLTHSASDIGNQANFSGAALMEDGVTLVEVQGLVVRAGGVAMGWERSHHSIKGSGLCPVGGHGGSRLSGIGGSVRVWEARGDDPIRHAVKVLISDLDLSKGPNGTGYRWPAGGADTGYETRYIGTNPDLVMGATLSLLPSVDVNALCSTPFGRRLARAIQDYGAICVDEGYGSWAPVMFTVEYGVNDALQARYGSNLEGGAIAADTLKIWQNLRVVTNCRDVTKGGGTPRQAPLPALA